MLACDRTTMNARFFSAITLVIATTSIAAEYQQGPGHFGGFSSAGTPITVADDFRFAEDTLVNRIVWWGGYFNPPATEPDNFTIRLFADDTGQPGALLATIAAGAVDRVATGQYVNPGLYPEFQYLLPLSSPFLAHAGQRYWISIVNPASGGNWLWEASSNSVNPGVQRSYADPVTGPWAPYTPDTAFALHTLPIVDSDGDGVPDPSDQCPGTPSGEVVNAHGCSIEQLVPCDGPWKNHGQYVSAIVRTSRAFASAGLITARQQRDTIAAAARSDCGKPGNPPVARENGKRRRLSIAPSPSRHVPVRR